MNKFRAAGCRKYAFLDPCVIVFFHVWYNKENLERQETNKNGKGTEQHLPKTDESVVRPSGERRYDI